MKIHIPCPRIYRLRKKKNKKNFNMKGLKPQGGPSCKPKNKHCYLSGSANASIELRLDNTQIFYTFQIRHRLLSVDEHRCEGKRFTFKVDTCVYGITVLKSVIWRGRVLVL